MNQKLHRIAIKISIISLCLLSPLKPFANTGDTIIVKGFNHLLHQNCNVGDSMYLFPPDSMHFYKIMLRYELSCPSFGCDIYDRIATLKVKQHTGVMDSTVTLVPSYKINGNSPDSVQFMFDTSYHYTYNVATMQIDSTPLNPLQIVLYGDSLNPTVATDTLNVWPSYYNQYIFNPNGVATDSMFVTPDSVIYLTHYSVYHPFEVINKYEIARAITPYGQGVVLWYDVSDYEMLLHDSVNLESVACGYSNGWVVTTDFYFIEGISPRHPYKITNLWNGTFLYGNTSDPIDSHLQPITLIVDSQSIYEKIRLITTGHGFGGNPNQNVAEFFNVNHTLKINNVNRNQNLWRSDCGRNPLYPQGAPGYTSTWFYKRANWCPGSYVTPHDYDATPLVGANDSLVVDYNMANYTNTGGPSGYYPPEYYIQSQAIFYDSIHYSKNAALYEIRRPNGAFEYNRMNPVCEAYSPMIVIKNYGVDTLQQLTVHYGVDGNISGTYQWTGNLSFMDTVSVQLPAISFGSGSHSFDIYIDQPNGSTDEFAYDDTMHVNFNATNIYNTNYIVLKLKTDNTPSQSSWKVRDDQGTILFQRNTFAAASTIYTDTVTLPNGCFNITVYDSNGNGTCCYNGTGYFRIYMGSNSTPLFNSGDYGDFYSTNLTLDFQSSINEELSKQFLSIYPNPASDRVVLNTGFESGSINVSLLDISGREAGKAINCRVSGYTTTFELPKVANGLYYLKIQKGDNVIVKKLVIEKQ
jgi:hypothetical protein